MISHTSTDGCDNTAPAAAAVLWTVAVLGKIFGGAWPLIIWEATTAKQNLL